MDRKSYRTLYPKLEPCSESLQPASPPPEQLLPAAQAEATGLPKQPPGRKSQAHQKAPQVSPAEAQPRASPRLLEEPLPALLAPPLLSFA